MSSNSSGEDRSQPAALANTLTHPAADASSGDWLLEAVSRVVPAVQGRMDLPLQILRDYLTREPPPPVVDCPETKSESC